MIVIRTDNEELEVEEEKILALQSNGIVIIGTPTGNKRIMADRESQRKIHEYLATRDG